MYFSLYCLKVNHRHELYSQILQCVLPGHQGSYKKLNIDAVMSSNCLWSVLSNCPNLNFCSCFQGLGSGPYNSSLNLVGISSIALSIQNKPKQSFQFKGSKREFIQSPMWVTSLGAQIPLWLVGSWSFDSSKIKEVKSRCFSNVLVETPGRWDTQHMGDPLLWGDMIWLTFLLHWWKLRVSLYIPEGFTE